MSKQSLRRDGSDTPSRQGHQDEGFFADPVSVGHCQIFVKCKEDQNGNIYQKQEDQNIVHKYIVTSISLMAARMVFAHFFAYNRHSHISR